MMFRIDPICGYYALLRQFTQCAHTARADMNGAHHAIYLDAATLHIKHKAAAGAELRMAHIVTIHRFALAYITTT